MMRNADPTVKQSMRTIGTLLAVTVAAIVLCAAASMAPNAVGAPLSARADGETVQVWLTLPDESKKLYQEPSLTFVAGSDDVTYTIGVDSSVAYQRIEGFGAAMTDSSAWLISTTLPITQRNGLMADLFTRDGDGIGLSYVRIPMGALDFALSSYTYDDMPAGQTDPDLLQFSIAHDKAYILPLLRQAKTLNPGIGFMGSPWSAPAWMKDNDNLNGGSLLPTYFDAFANYHVKFAQAYQAAGVPIDTLTPQNEPMHETPGYPTMYMEAAHQATFVRNHLGPAIDAAGLDTEIIILDHNWNLANYALTILNDPATKPYVGGTAFHCYSGDPADQSIVHDSHPDMGVWFTECSGGGWATDFGDNMTWNLQNLVIGNMRNWGKSLLLWNLALDENDGPQNGGCSNCRGVVTIDSGGAVTYNEEYYILGHASKFVDPGAYRIESTGFITGEPENVAFHNPDGSIVLIVHSAVTTTFGVEWGGQHFGYTLPAQGTVTFKWPGGVTPAPTITSVPTNTPAPTPTLIPPHPPGLLQEFEQEGSYYEAHNADASLGDVAHSGSSSLKMSGGSGEWHKVGAYLYDRPINATAYEQICLWVYDTADVAPADNSMEMFLVDANGDEQNTWSDWASNPSNPRTVQDTWVRMCFNLSAYDLIDLSALDSVQMGMYWGNTYYFDDIEATGLYLVKHADSGGLDEVPLGGAITYTIVISNARDDVASAMMMTDPLPPAVSFASHLSGSTLLPLPGNVYHWGPHDVAARDVKTIRFVVNVTTSNSFAGDTVVNTAYVTADNVSNAVSGGDAFVIEGDFAIYLPLVLR